MKPKILFLLVGIMVYANCYGQEKKSEIEINNIYFGFGSKSSNLGLSGKYRYFLNKKFAVYTAVDINNINLGNESPKANQWMFNLRLGVGANYYFKNSDKGLYLNAGVYKNFAFTNSSLFSKFEPLNTELGLGYKLPISSKIFIIGEVNHNYNFNLNDGRIIGKLGVGLRF